MLFGCVRYEDGEPVEKTVAVDEEDTDEETVEEPTEEVSEESTEEIAEETTDSATTEDETEALPEEIADLNPTDVRNDNTGEWQVVVTSNNVRMPDNAQAYYEEYMDEDGNHYIVSFATNTTINLNAMGNMLFVTVTEYQDGEEHDANALASGMLLQDYIVYLDTGEIEQL
ncbi:hypothetical protein ACFOJ8_03140 [Salinicoccus sesuvii]